MIEERVKKYWTVRAHDFGVVRKNELENQMSGKWLEELESHLPQKRDLRILDASIS